MEECQNGVTDWVWKDGVGGYAEFIEKQKEREISETPSDVFGAVLFDQGDVTLANLVWMSMKRKMVMVMEAGSVSTSASSYSSDLWHSEIFNYISYGHYDKKMDRVQLRALLHKYSSYRIIDGTMFRLLSGEKRRCILQSEVSEVLSMAHDRGGHWSAEQTLNHLRKYYWPRMASDIRSYVLGCLRCAKHGVKGLNMPQSSARVTAPFILLGVDLIGPLPDVDLDVHEAWVRLWPQLSDVYNQWKCAYGPQFKNYPFEVEQTPQPSIKFKFSHVLPFGSKAVKNFLENLGVIPIPAPVGAHRSVGIVEKHNDLIERVLKKGFGMWPLELQDAVKSLNVRVVKNLGYTPHEILFGFQPVKPIGQMYPSANLVELQKSIRNLKKVDTEDDMCMAQLSFIVRRNSLREQTTFKDDGRRAVQKDRHDSGLSSSSVFSLGFLVMLYDEAQAKKKLRASYRGPFVILGYGGDHGRSYVLRQISGQPIYRTFHGDQLKLFRPREGYLVSKHEEGHLGYQNICGKSTYAKLPSSATKGRVG
ncbi:putative eka-like protein [Golovinomyces cichoracearum]|uniref:Putative eka-like protein n=1 Tax=Golovinomyces cichoracearum TaxID=62708 RepID=A0A420ITM5_9PEZI|nr:putative eka-like protein [Golovinomyces cichoracearum]